MVDWCGVDEGCSHSVDECNGVSREESSGVRRGEFRLVCVTSERNNGLKKTFLLCKGQKKKI